MVIEVESEQWKKKPPLLHIFVYFQMPNKRLQAWLFFYEWDLHLSQKKLLWRLQCRIYEYDMNVPKGLDIISIRNYFFLKNYPTSNGAVCHKVVYYQVVSIARYQVSFHTVSSACDTLLSSCTHTLLKTEEFLRFWAHNRQNGGGGGVRPMSRLSLCLYNPLTA